MAVAAGLLVLVLLSGSVYLLSYALVPDDNIGRDYRAEYRYLSEHYPETTPWLDSLRRAGALRDTFITRDDGTRLHALMIPAPLPTGRTAVLLHGYSRSAVWMLGIGYIYHHHMGFNLLLPDFYGHGKSDGRAAGMGWSDRPDVHRWMRIAADRYRDSTGCAAVVVHGVSMGASAAMAVAGDRLPNEVKAIVEDCGYSSVWDEFRWQLDREFGLPPFPLLYTASALCKLKYGWSFGEASMLRCVAASKLPMLFVHGDRDTYVPTDMVRALYAAKPAPKSLYLAPGSKHTKSYRDHREAYVSRLKRFLAPYV